MNPPILSTGDLIAAPAATPLPTPAPLPAPAPAISPAQTPAPQVPSIPTIPTVPTSSSSSSATDLAVNEARVRHFQSEADKKTREAEQARQEAEAAKRELEALRVTSTTVLEGARQAAERALQEVESLRKAREADQAQALKASILLEEGYRSLAPYAGFIQPSNDATQIRAQLDALKAAREADLAAHAPTTTPQQPPTPPAFSTPAVAPVQSMQPSRPQPTATPTNGGNVAEQIRSIMQQAYQQLQSRQITPFVYEQEMEKARAMATAEAHRQRGLAQ